jgi:UDP-2,3-diacylglucosamine pyrophosphatase LpxH
MLAVISDLHFTDGTTSNTDAGGKDLFNVSPKAFELFFADLSETVGRAADGKGATQVTLVYAGDIFDPLRTTAWFDVPQEATPWGSPLNAPAMTDRCQTIMGAIVAHNAEALSWLAGTHPRFDAVWRCGATIERVYLPGNHDRVVNLDPAMRGVAWDKLLGKPGTNAPFDHTHADATHRTLVIHGHEADAFNCEFDADGKPIYAAVPVGDAMTTMLFARLAHEASRTPGLPGDAIARLREIDNVRPALATVRFVKDVIRDFGLGDRLDRVIQRVVNDFVALPYVEDWKGRNDKWSFPWNPDAVDKLQIAVGAIRALGSGVSPGLLERGAAVLAEAHACEATAEAALRRRNAAPGADLLFCVMGHTHEPDHTPLLYDRAGKVERHYLNSGTFRSTFAQTHDGNDFLRHQRLSYVVIHAPGELDPALPMFEMWSGVRKDA